MREREEMTSVLKQWIRVKYTRVPTHTHALLTYPSSLMAQSVLGLDLWIQGKMVLSYSLLVLNE